MFVGMFPKCQPSPPPLPLWWDFLKSNVCAWPLLASNTALQAFSPFHTFLWFISCLLCFHISCQKNSILILSVIICYSFLSFLDFQGTVVFFCGSIHPFLLFLFKISLLLSGTKYITFNKHKIWSWPRKRKNVFMGMSRSGHAHTAAWHHQSYE